MKNIIKLEKIIKFRIDDGFTDYENDHNLEWEPDKFIYHGLTYWKCSEITTNYDEHGNITSSICKHPDGTSTLIIENEYDTNGVLRKQIKKESEKSVYEVHVFDENGQLVKIINYDAISNMVNNECNVYHMFEGELRYERIVRKRPLGDFIDNMKCKIYSKNGKLLKIIYDELNAPDTYFRCEYNESGNLKSTYECLNGKENISSEHEYDEPDPENWMMSVETDYSILKILREQDWLRILPNNKFATSITLITTKAYW